MKNTLLDRARKEYKTGTLFLSATGNLKKPLRITTLRMASNSKNTVVNSEFGVIYTEGVWAKKV